MFENLIIDDDLSLKKYWRNGKWEAMILFPSIINNCILSILYRLKIITSFCYIHNMDYCHSNHSPHSNKIQSDYLGQLGRGEDITLRIFRRRAGSSGAWCAAHWRTGAAWLRACARAHSAATSTCTAAWWRTSCRTCLTSSSSRYKHLCSHAYKCRHFSNQS